MQGWRTDRPPRLLRSSLVQGLVGLILTLHSYSPAKDAQLVVISAIDLAKPSSQQHKHRLKQLTQRLQWSTSNKHLRASIL